MNPLLIFSLKRSQAKPRALFGILLFTIVTTTIARSQTDDGAWQQRHDQLVARLRVLTKMESAFGSAYEPLYHAALPWYEQWGGRNRNPVDSWMESPEDYAEKLADALEHGRNFIVENPGALLPLAFTARLPDGRAVSCNYWLVIPPGFGEPGRKFPLIVSLHGSGWLGHKISYVRHTKAYDRGFEVTPINEGGPWQLDFLNAYLDELLRILPVDPDRVYAQGHSLGGMATYEWALNNPERFAAISPRSGIGEPYRASRIRNVPVWIIHGERDAVVPAGFSDQMASALQACGGRVRYSLLRAVEHNMPSDLDERQVRDWFLSQVRNPGPPPPDPRDALGLGREGYSPWEIVTLPECWSWKSDELGHADRQQSTTMLRTAAKTLFDRAHAKGGQVDHLLRLSTDLARTTTSLWLELPTPLRSLPIDDAAAIKLASRRVVRFYGRGPIDDALAHARTIEPELKAAGHTMSGRIWITPLAMWYDAPASIAEYWLELSPQ